MYWYKFHCVHGPGHQGSSTEYRCYPRKMSREERKETYDSWLNPYWEWPIGYIRLVNKIPVDERDRMIAEYEGRRKADKLILEVLRSAPVFVPRKKKQGIKRGSKRR